jgi:obg-like ATPase 1
MYLCIVECLVQSDEFKFSSYPELIPGCITLKPVVYLVNCSEKSYCGGGNKYLQKIKEWVNSHGGGLVLPMSVEFEEKVAAARKAGDLDGAQALLDTVSGGRGVMLPRIIKCGYNQLKLMYYFTAGEKEVRCWTVAVGATAPQAAGVIHTDFETGFIKLECCSFDDFMACNDGRKSMAAVKDAGKYRQEGKTYIVQGEIIIRLCTRRCCRSEVYYEPCYSKGIT